MKQKKESIISMTALALVALAWGTSYAVTKDVLNEIRPFTLMALRFGFSTVLLSAVFLKKLRCITRKDIKQGSVTGIFMFLAFFCLVTGILYTTASKQAFIVGAYVLIVPLLSWFINKKRPGIYSIIAAVLATAGIGLLTLNGSFSINKGDLISILCALFFACHMIAIEHFSYDSDPIKSTILQFAVTAVLFIILMCIFEPLSLSLTPKVIKSVAYLVIFTTVIPFVVQNIAQKHISSTSTALILTLESAFGGIFAVFFLHENMTVQMIAGCLIIFAGIITQETKWGFRKAD